MLESSFNIGWRRRRRETATRSGSSSSLLSSTESHGELEYYRHTDADSQKRREASVHSETEVTVSLDLAENSLLRFVRDGVPSSAWNVFDPRDRMRVAYVGTHTSNLSHLVNLDQQRPQYLIYPHPEIHPPHPWKPEAARREAGDDIRRDVNHFPVKHIRDNLVDSFFEKISPYFPVVDEADFRERYYVDLENKPPNLLVDAVLLAGAHVSCHPDVVPKRYAMKMAIFRRAEHLFNIRHENDRMNLVQAALLFTWHLQNSDTTSSNNYYWLGVACRIAFGLGAHRDLLTDPLSLGRMPLSDRRLWRRVWWTLFQAEVMSALEHGRPSMIRLNDFDQSPLAIDDLIEVSGAKNNRIDFEYCTRNIELCHIALEVAELSAPRAPVEGRREAATTLLIDRLVSWMLRLHPTTSERDSFAGLNLRLHYHMVVLHLYRVIASDDGPRDEEIRRTASISANSIVSCLEILHSSGTTAQCHFTAVTALTSAAINVSKEVQQSLRDAHTMSAINQMQVLDRACVAASHLSKYWPNTEGIRKVFRSLLEQFTGALSSMQDGHRSGSNEMIFADEMSRLNWIDLLAPPSQIGYSSPSDPNSDPWIFGLYQ